MQSYHFSHVIRENSGGNEGTYCGVAVDSSGNLYIQHANGFFEDGAYTDKFHPGRWKVNPSPPQIWPVAGIFQQPEDGGTCKISSDANQFLYTARGEYTGTGTLKRWPMSAVELVSPPFKVIDTGVTPSMRISRPAAASTRTRSQESPDSTRRENLSRSSAKAT